MGGPAVAMGDLAVECYEDGGALPLCEVALSQTCQNNRHPVVGGNYARSSQWCLNHGFKGFYMMRWRS